jgi:hypothetical protein
MRLLRSLVILSLAALVAGTVPAAAQNRVYLPPRSPMNFFIAEGSGAGPHQRWIAASGQIRSDTVTAFEAFAKRNKLDGLVLALDSTGGSVEPAMRLGRLFRQNNLTVVVGKTLEVGFKNAELVFHLSTREGSCNSACVLLLMGGAKRLVSPGAFVGVHQFSRAVNSDGSLARPEITVVDFERAQMLTADLAVYYQEMGIDQRLLQITTSVGFRQPLRRLTPEEIRTTKLAEVGELDPAGEGPMEWVYSDREEDPLLLGSRIVEDTPQRRVEEEITVACSPFKGFHTALYRQFVHRFEKGAKAVVVHTARLASGEEDYVFRAFNDKPITGARAGADLWMRRPVPSVVFETAIKTKSLTIAPSPAIGDPPVRELYSDNFERHYDRLVSICRLRTDSQTVGPHPWR